MIYVAKVVDGYCRLYNAANGSWQRNIGVKGVVSAQVQGDLVIVTYKDGTVKIYNANSGSWERTLH